ncbi:MAG: metallophosphatase domain-containing protein [Saprospiraceae bacterium]|nr:metallophosphatase domain-containing protein [Saprospiraceae bacterium]
MRIVFISDTHLKHDSLPLPPGDMLVHAGDFSRRGLMHEAQIFLDWFSAQPHRHKVLVAGNHDFIAENEPALFESMLPKNVIYLNDSGREVEGIKIWGSPIQPWFFDWAFNRQRGADIRRHWDLIPADTELLITHGPPYGILDEVARDPRPVGCRDLLHKVSEMRQLKIHVFGHIHEGYGRREVGGTLFLNASVLDENYNTKNKPFLVEWSEVSVSIIHESI